MQRAFAIVAIATMLFALVPAEIVTAQTAPEETTSEEETSTDGADGTDGSDTGGDTTDTGDDDTEPIEEVESEDTGTTTETETATSTEGESTDDGGDGTDGGTGGGDGTDGESATSTEETATSTDESTASTTDDGTGTTTDDGTGTTTDDGTEGDSGGEGSGGSEGEEGSDGSDGTGSTSDQPEPILDEVEIITEHNFGADSTPEDGEDITGSRSQTGRNTSIVTGEATAHNELVSDVNSVDARSEIDLSTYTDLDNYYFTATGTNDAVVGNTTAARAMTGDNAAYSTGPAEIITGNSYAGTNIANVVNTNVVNSDGFMYLGNQIIEPQQSLDLTDFFYPDPDSELARATDCTLLSCVSEDIHYSISQENTATITNEVSIESITGENYADGDFADVSTGDAYGAANVMNIVNTNIIDSNYRFLTLNAMGDLDGDLLLPTEELLYAFYSRPNGMTQVEQAEEISLFVGTDNEARVSNDVETYAESGLNESLSLTDGAIITGNAEAESNELNKINTNIFGGDVMYLLIRVHGIWDGEVKGLPEGLSWMWVQEGVLIYNTDGEIAPSPILPYDVDSYNAEVINHNEVMIDNNVIIDSISGMNQVSGLIGHIETGDAVASANVMNVANTNVIGANWTYAVINIFGDFSGDVTFSEIDLALSGSVDEGPFGPSDVISYSYTIHNNSTLPAYNVVLRQTLQNATVDGTAVTQSKNIGTLTAGDTKVVQFTAIVDSDIPIGTTSVEAIAVVESDEGEIDQTDNSLLLSVDAVKAEDTSTTTDDGTASTTDDGTGTTTDDGTASTTDDGTATTTDDGTNTPLNLYGCMDSSAKNFNAAATVDDGSCTYKSSGGGGGRNNNTTSIDRNEGALDDKSASFITIKKFSDVDDDEVVKAGEEVNYTIEVRNKGGIAHNAILHDTLTNPSGSEMDTQSWELGTILAGEEITIEYTTVYNANTPSGTYTNTAFVEAYKTAVAKENGDRPLMLDEAVHTIVIDGVPLAVGDVAIVAYYPSGSGGTSVLLSWETNAPATGQVFYSPRYAGSLYNPVLPNFGYQHGSFRFNTPKTKHYMILRNLTPGVEYAYRIRSTSGADLGLGGDYYFTVPSSVNTLTLSYPSGRPLSFVAGISTTSPTPATTPAPYTPPAVVPTPAVKPSTSAAATEPEPIPEPTHEPEPDPQEQPTSGGGFFNKVVNFFR